MRGGKLKGKINVLYLARSTNGLGVKLTRQTSKGTIQIDLQAILCLCYAKP